MKRICFRSLFVLLFLLLCFALPVSAQSDPRLEAQFEAAGGEDIFAFYSEELSELSDIVPDFSPSATLNAMLTGEVPLTPTALLQWLLTLLWGTLRQNAAFFGVILLISVLSGLTQRLEVLGGNGIGGAAVFFCTAAICAVLLEMFDLGVREGREAVGQMSDFVTVTAPVMAALLAGSGQVTGAALISPVLYGSAAFSVNTVNRLLIPAIYACFLLCIANSLSGDGSFGGIIALIKNAMKWILGILLTVFSGLTAVYSVAGQNVDVLLSRTARFAVGNFVPVVGGMLTESVELILSLSSVLRKGVGVVGIVILLLVFAHTAVTLTVQLWMFRIGAAFARPLGSAQLSALLSDTAACIGMMLAVLCVGAVLFCFLLIIMISAGGGGLV